MDEYSDDYPQVLVKDLLWSRKYHLKLVKAIESQLLELSKKHQITINLD